MSQSRNTDAVQGRTKRLTSRARAWLFWERYAPVFMIAALCAALYAIAAMAGIWERIGDPWRAIALVVSLYFLVKSALAARYVKAPSRSDAARRVERDNGVAHRPLDVIHDRAALLTAQSDSTWAKHVARARDVAAGLKPAKPVSVIAPRDRYYLRFAAPIALILAAMVGAGDNWQRLTRSLSPNWQSAMSANGVSYDAWVDPPDYTGRPPIYFKNKSKIDVPAGSELVARISGIKDAPRLKLTTDMRAKYLPLSPLGPESFEARTVLDQNVTARWRIGNTRKAWDISVIPDTPPTVTIDVEPKADKRDRLAFRYSMADDFGVETLSLVMQLMDGDTQSVETVIVPLSARSVRKADGTDVALDMTKHVWTGRKVRGHLRATDGLGQSAQTSDFTFTIPDRIFIEPLAKAVVEQRALIVSGMQMPYAPPPRRTRKDWQNMPVFDGYQSADRLDRAPATIQRAAALMDAVTDAPAGLYEDPAVFMGLKNALGRLRYARATEELSGLPEDLWDIAIRAEFGVLGTALEEMRAAQVALNEGIARRAPEREIDTLFDRYDAAVERYMEELRRKAEEEGNVAEGGEGGAQGGRNVDEIEALLKAIEEANAQGDTEGARRALAQLAELLENMQIQLAQGGGGGGGGESSGEMSEETQESLEDLADLLGEQRELNDETEQAQREAEQQGEQAGQQPGSQSGGEQSGQGAGERSEDGSEDGVAPNTKSAEELAAQQEQLQALLDQLETGLPEGPLGQTRADAAQGQEGDGQPGSGETGDAQSGGGEQPSGDEATSGGGGEGSDEATSGSGGRGSDNADDAETPSAGKSVESAAEAMQRAKDALEAGDLAKAAEIQNDIIKALREAAQALAAQAAEGRADQDGTDQAAGDGNPLGQNEQGGNDGLSEADIDQRDNATRSRELREELRRRASEQEREQSERDYLERLLERF